MGLAIQLDQAAPVIVLKLRGELDHSTAPNLEAQLPRLLTRLEQSRAEWVLLDTEELQFLDMSGIRALTTCWREVRLSGARGIALIADQTPVMASYRWARLHELFPIYRTQEEALREIGASPGEDRTDG
jgi:stage II sporulation protein AA (anti-sigma F factor antagonist)